MMVSICGEGVRMRGADHQQSGMFSYISAEERVPKDHPLRAIRAMIDVALRNMGRSLRRCTPKWGGHDCPGEAAAGAVAAGALYGAQRADADGAIELQSAVSLVCGNERRRCGVGRDRVHQES